MDVDIIHSGSSGNCAVINDTLIIDAGWKCDVTGVAVLLTHCHTDHTKHIEQFGGMPIYATAETAQRLLDTKFPYLTFSVFNMEEALCINERYYVFPVPLNHDVPCVGFDITDVETYTRILYATDFNSFVDESYIIGLLQEKKFDALYMECNNTLDVTSFHDVYFPENGVPPKDAFHRKKSFENHCNASYLESLFRRAGYNESNRFTEPVTLLHKSSYYYQHDQTKLVALAKIANITNILF